MRWACWTWQSALGELAIAARYVRPRIDNGLAFNITRGRHPVVEAALASRQCRALCAQ